MKVLVSPVSLEEAGPVIAGGADIIDVKNVKEGSLGASFPWVIRGIAAMAKGRPITVSATLGDLPYKPGTASLAALGAVQAGARYIKAGLHGTRSEAEALEVMCAVVRSCREADAGVVAVAAGYADYRRFGGLDPAIILRVARDSGADVAMLDTAVKDGASLFDALAVDELEAFVAGAHAAGLQAALAGSIRAGHLENLRRIGADVVGIRGAVCRGHDRGAAIDAGLLAAFVARARMAAAA
ncbi:MAG TPA: (5-formylfuran-3-yl)methyl phosphate synthase [Dongiaceae bacterium]|nr:(5-formylfuran-3-yl)methyl phosphate synthase [Dongiaceae bacterium]